MIKATALVADRNEALFMEKVQATIEELQLKGLVVEIQYKYDDYRNVAFIIGRTK